MLRTYGTAVIAVIFAAAVSIFLLDQRTETPLLPFLPAILVAAYVGGIGPAILASVLSALVAIVFLLEPRYAFAVEDRIQTVGLVILAFGGIAIGAGVERLRRNIARAREAEAAKTLRLHEVQHRIGNSLQLVSSMILIQAQQTSDPRTREGLRDVVGRIGTLGRIYRRLAGSDDSRVELGPYFRQLCDDLTAANGRGGISCSVEAADFALEPERAVLLALIANELITNSLKYAFADGRPGHIGVALRAVEGGRLALEVADDGLGMRWSEAPREDGGLGLRLVRSLAAQLGGHLSIETGNGTHATVQFPAR